MVEKILSKVICRECSLFNEKHRCGIRKTVKALRPGKRRRCGSFKAKYIEVRKQPKVTLRELPEKKVAVGPVIEKKIPKKENFWQRLLKFFKRSFRWKKSQSSA